MSPIACGEGTEGMSAQDGPQLCIPPATASLLATGLDGLCSLHHPCSEDFTSARTASPHGLHCSRRSLLLLRAPWQGRAARRAVAQASCGVSARVRQVPRPPQGPDPTFLELCHFPSPYQHQALNGNDCFLGCWF